MAYLIGDPGRHMGHEFQEFRKYDYEFDPSGTLLGDEFNFEYEPSETRAKTRPLGDEFNFEYDPNETRAKTRSLGDEFNLSDSRWGVASARSEMWLPGLVLIFGVNFGVCVTRRFMMLTTVAS